MVTRKTTAGKKGISKPKLKKETIKDLDGKGKAGNVKGGGGIGRPTLVGCHGTGYQNPTW